MYERNQSIFLGPCPAKITFFLYLSNLLCGGSSFILPCGKFRICIPHKPLRFCLRVHCSPKIHFLESTSYNTSGGSDHVLAQHRSSCLGPFSRLLM